MSTEFDYCIIAVFNITSDIEDANAFTIAERVALDLLLEGLRDRNQWMLSKAETGRSTARKRG